MWTLAQFETFGALRFDSYLRYLVTKLAVVWRSIITLHKTAVNYSFTVSISESPSIGELQDLLEGRVPLLLTYDDIPPHEYKYKDDGRSRGSSLASTAYTEDCHRESMDWAMDLEVKALMEEEEEEEEVKKEKPAVIEYMALEDQDITELFTIEDDGWSEVDSELSVVESEVECTEPIKSPIRAEEAEKIHAKIVALRSVLVPVLPLPSGKHSTHPHTAPSVEPQEPLMVPLIKPLIQTAKPVKWEARSERPEAAPLMKQAKRPLKRRISVNMTSMKPLPRLVVKARPSTLSPPENVQRMLDQVEKMMREVHDLLAAGREMMRSVDPPSPEETERNTKTVRFCEEVNVIEPGYEIDSDEEEELRSSLHYLPEELELMSEEFFSANPLLSS